MTVRIEPIKEQLSIWVENYVPQKDLFFVEETDLMTLAEYLSAALVVPREEFFEHPSYTQIQMNNSYMYWNISTKVRFVIVAKPDWITTLPKDKRRDLLFKQYKVGRGLIFPLPLFTSASLIPQEYIFEDKGEKFFVIQQSVWNELSYQEKEKAIQGYAQLWDDWFSNDFPEQTPLHIKKYANSFPSASGSNCFSATLFAITEQDWIIDEWVYPITLLNGLERANFSLVNDEIKKGDIVIWVDEEGNIKHAAYHIDDHIFFNKNGQTFFNPWKIVHLNKLNEEWGQYKRMVYRKRWKYLLN